MKKAIFNFTNLGVPTMIADVSDKSDEYTEKAIKNFEMLGYKCKLYTCEDGKDFKVVISDVKEDGTKVYDVVSN